MPAFRGKITEKEASQPVATVRALGGKPKSDEGPQSDKTPAEPPRPKGPSEHIPGETPSPKEPTKAPEELMSETSSLQKLVAWLGRFHPAAVHVPLGLLLAAGVVELLFFATDRQEFGATSRICIWFAGITAPLAAALGWVLARAQPTDMNWVLTVHRWLGTSNAACTIAALVLIEVSCRARSSLRGTFRLLLVLNIVLALATGFFGGALVHGLDYYAWPLSVSGDE